MPLAFFMKGLLLGFSIAAPVGPIGVLCIRRTLADGRAAGLVSGLGAATADALYGGVAGLGLTFFSQSLIRAQGWLRLFGGLFLCFLGIKTFLAKPAAQAATAARSRGLAGAFASTFALTLTNPATLLSFAAAYAGLGAVRAGQEPGATAALVLGVFWGSALWWLVLSGSVERLRARTAGRSLRSINRISGIILFGFGLSALALGIGGLLAPGAAPTDR
jgi:threonine/homoserine/homoserine lactone efflux protein